MNPWEMFDQEVRVIKLFTGQPVKGHLRRMLKARRRSRINQQTWRSR